MLVGGAGAAVVATGSSEKRLEAAKIAFGLPLVEAT